MKAFKHILVPTDFGEPSQRALDLAVDLAQQYQASLTVIHTYEIPTYVYTDMTYVPSDLLLPMEKIARQELDRLLTALRTRVPEATGLLRMGVPWQQVLSAIEETHADLVVMGTHGRRGVSHLLLGSVVEKVVRMSPVPVLTVQAPKPAT
jgi:nucleotide-binding universal stress UspA family protein